MYILCRGDLIRILTKLLRRKSKLDHIIIETTGLADPGPVIQTFFTGLSFCLRSIWSQRAIFGSQTYKSEARGVMNHLESSSHDV